MYCASFIDWFGLKNTRFLNQRIPLEGIESTGCGPNEVSARAPPCITACPATCAEPGPNVCPEEVSDFEKCEPVPTFHRIFEFINRIMIILVLDLYRDRVCMWRGLRKIDQCQQSLHSQIAVSQAVIFTIKQLQQFNITVIFLATAACYQSLQIKIAK